MRKPENNQLIFDDIAINDILKRDDFYQPLLKLVDFSELMKPYRDIYSHTGAPGHPIETGVKCILVQIFEDRSDRQLEKLILNDVRIRYFCGFNIADRTPDHSYFGDFRKRLGSENIEKIHNYIVEKLKTAGLIGGFCSFIDTSEIIRKINVWTERDKKIEEELERLNLNRDLMKKEPLKKKSELKKEVKLNNSNVSDYSSDPDAKIGCKGEKKYWFGYKRGVCVDAKYEIITKVAVEPANEVDHRFAFKLFPETGACLMDKGFDVDELYEKTPAGVAVRAIKKRNRKDKNRDLDRWISSIRSPFESIFNKLSKRTRYVGLAKNKFKGFIEAIAHNLKRTLKAGVRLNNRFPDCPGVNSANLSQNISPGVA
jgi:IS5 family transposase